VNREKSGGSSFGSAVNRRWACNIGSRLFAAAGY
jgi:hypothetical protein